MVPQWKFSQEKWIAAQEVGRIQFYCLLREKAQPHQMKTHKNKTLLIHESAHGKQPPSPAGLLTQCKVRGWPGTFPSGCSEVGPLSLLLIAESLP